MLLATSLVPDIAHGQTLVKPEARQGYYFGTGLRLGSNVGEAEDVGALGNLQHLGLSLRAGQKALPWLGLGLQFNAGGDANDDWTLNKGGLLLEVQVEPFPFDLALRGAIGVEGGSISRVDSADERKDDPSFMFGSTYIVGISYDWFPFHNPKSYKSGGGAFTFFLEGRFSPLSSVTLGGGFIGVEFTWWTGLNKRKLLLPVEKAFQ